MSILWMIDHRFAASLPVLNKVDSYPSLGITIDYVDSNISVIHHTLSSNKDKLEIIESSKNELKLFFELLQFWYGLPLPVITSSARVVNDTSMQITHSKVPTNLDSLLSGNIKMPNPSLFSELDERKYILLFLANDARNSGNKVHAIRNYYIILEELHTEDYDTDKDRLKLRYIRDFVSHHKITKNKKIIDLIECETGSRTDSYNPHNEKHQLLISRYWQIGEKLVDKEFEQLTLSTSPIG